MIESEIGKLMIKYFKTWAIFIFLTIVLSFILIFANVYINHKEHENEIVIGLLISTYAILIAGMLLCTIWKIKKLKEKYFNDLN